MTNCLSKFTYFLSDWLLDVVHDLRHCDRRKTRVRTLQSSDHGVHPKHCGNMRHLRLCKYFKTMTSQIFLLPWDHFIVVHQISHVLSQVLCHLFINTKIFEKLFVNFFIHISHYLSDAEFEFCLLRLVFFWLEPVTCPPEVRRASVPETVPSTTSTSDTWADHLRLSLSWPGVGTGSAPGANSTSLGLPATATHNTRSLRRSRRRGFVLTTCPEELNSSLWTSSSRSNIFVPSFLPILPPRVWSFSVKASTCSHSLFRSFSISAKDSSVVKANCKAILSSWPGGVALRRSWRSMMNWGNLWIGFTIKPKKFSLSWALICLT